MSLNFNKYAITLVLFLERINLLPPLRLIKLKYYLRFGHRLDLSNPKNLNEKILWLSFHSDTSLWTALSDKYAVREFVESKGLKSSLVELYGVYENADQIDFDNLPQSFVLKTNNGSGTVLLVEDKNKLNINETRLIMDKWLKIPFGLMSGEPHYRKIKPCIIAEEYLNGSNSISKSIIDYKIWCFNGVPYYAFTGCNRDIVNHKVDFNLYEVDGWNFRKEFISEKYRNDIAIPKPVQLEKILEYAQILSNGFPQVRIDFYEVNEVVYFGEMTFTSQAGLMPYFTDECLEVMGAKINLPR